MNPTVASPIIWRGTGIFLIFFIRYLSFFISPFLFLASLARSCVVVWTGFPWLNLSFFVCAIRFLWFLAASCVSLNRGLVLPSLLSAVV
jgi:hypothetical protein